MAVISALGRAEASLDYIVNLNLAWATSQVLAWATFMSMSQKRWCALCGHVYTGSSAGSWPLAGKSGWVS